MRSIRAPIAPADGDDLVSQFDESRYQIGAYVACGADYDDFHISYDPPLNRPSPLRRSEIRLV
jgi:hypothetical protein